MKPSENRNGGHASALPGPEWQRVDFPGRAWGGSAFVSAEPEGERLRVSYFVREADKALMAKVWFGPQASGPPGHAHGGAMAAVLDEAMGMAAWVAGYIAFALSLEVRFAAMLPLETEAVAEAWVERVNGRKVTLKARLAHAETGTVYAECEGMFLKATEAQLEGLMVEKSPNLVIEGSSHCEE